MQARAQNTPYSVTTTGQLGLNTVPSARMDTPGTIRAGVSALDPYTQGFLGFQIAAPLYVSLRQTAESSALLDAPDRLYPGVDVKLRLLRERKWVPELSLGVQSALGHKRTSGEYIAASKRYKNFDVTAGLGWGRYGSAAQIKNPLGVLHSHFDEHRNTDGESPARPANWFTGQDAGLFAGVEYFMPWVDGLSVKADIGADRYTAERAASGFGGGSTWSVGVNYAPANWIDLSAELNGKDKIMARLSVQNTLDTWPGRANKNKPAPSLNPYRSDIAPPKAVERAAYADSIFLMNARQNERYSRTDLNLSSDDPPALQIGRAARHMANHSPKSAEGLQVTPFHLGLRGPVITMMRRDFESALIKKQGSPEEIWRNTTIDKNSTGNLSAQAAFKTWNIRLTLDNDISLSEEDTGVIYRSALLVDETKELPYNFIAGARLRINLHDNLHRLDKFRTPSALPVRTNIDDFTNHTLSVDRSFLGWFKTLNTDWHAGITAGYLEEMYGGLGGEILYRPFGKTYAFGAQAWQVFKRDPATPFNTGFSYDSLLTGHAGAYYEIPDTDMTASLQVGRYLAEDIGGTFTLEKRLRNGVKLKGFVTATDQADADIFGSSTHLYSGIGLSLPIGNIPYITPGSKIGITAAPIGRDAGQRLEPPLPLYDLTEPLSYRALTQSWSQILD